MRVLVNFLQANRVVVDGLEQRLRAEAGLSLAQLELLARLAQAPERRLRMIDLAHLLQVSKSGITRLVDRLEKAGFVVRESSPSDRRLTYAALTPEGLEVFKRYEPVFAAAVDEYFAKHLTAADVSALQTVLRQILDGNGAWDEARCAPIYDEPAPRPMDEAA